jgi:hypothetical protein
MNSIFTLVVAGSAGLIAFSVARRALRERFFIGPSNLLDALVAGMAFLGLLQSDDGLISALLMLYAALALALLLLFLWRRFTELAKPLARYQRNPGRNPAQPGDRDFSNNSYGSPGRDRSTGEESRSRQRTPPTPDPNNSG